jgi:hypothetical protein
MNHGAVEPSSLVISYLNLRKAVGILGALLPFTLSLGALLLFGTGIQASMSSYYHTGMRDVLVGALWAIGVFLLSYRGYERQDDVAGTLACIFAVGVAVFPTSTEGDVILLNTVSILHLVFASLFFLTLAYFSLVLFTKTDPTKTPTRRKLQRNRVYRICGYTMVAAIVLIAALTLLPLGPKQALSRFNPVFWLESLAVVAFGVSWLTKGEAMLKDET